MDRVSEIIESRKIRAEAVCKERIDKFYTAHPELQEVRDEKRKLGNRLIMEAISGGNPEKVREELKQIESKEKQMFKDLKITESFFKPDYYCSNCEDTGFVNGVKCGCRKQLEIYQNYDMSSIRKQIESQNFDKFDLNVFRKDRQQDECISPYEAMKELHDLMKDEYVGYFSVDSPNLFFYGPTGVGKTYLINCIAKGVMDKGYTVLYQTAPKILSFLTEYSFMYHDEKLKHEDQYKLCFDCDLLIIDDLGTEFINEKLISELFELINVRLTSHKPTVISSNIKPEELEVIYNERIASRIAGEYQIFKIFGSDLRRRLY